MAIRVLRMGNSIFPVQITCCRCKALLEIERASDLKIYTDPDSGRVPQIVCPVCGQTIMLYDADRAQALVEYDRER